MDLQQFLEEKAAKPVFAVTFFSMMARAAAFWTGQGARFEAWLGPAGMQWYNGLTGLSLAAGAELLGSIAGRSWRRNGREAHEAEGRKGMSKAEREALVKYFQSKARLDFVFMCIGIGSSYVAALNFLLTSNPDHTGGTVIAELVMTTLMMAIISYLGIFFEGKRVDSTEKQAAQAQVLSDRIINAAGQRIAANAHTPQDVRVFARALPTKVDRERFLAAFAAETPDDPHWTTNDIANWLDCNDTAGKRAITRKLSRLERDGAPVMRNDKGAYIIPRSVVFLHFADDFLNMSRNSQSTPSVRTIRRQSGPLNPQDATKDTDAEGAATGARRAENREHGAIVSLA